MLNKPDLKDSFFGGYTTVDWNKLPNNWSGLDLNTIESNVIEEKGNSAISIAMPGIDKTKIDANIIDGTLIVKYTDKNATDYWGKKTYSFTKKVGSFKYSSADYRDGILYIYLQEKKDQKKIEIK